MQVSLRHRRPREPVFSIKEKEKKENFVLDSQVYKMSLFCFWTHRFIM